MPSKLQICCEALMEACWLAAAVIFPLFFNISSVRMFEPDKMFVFKFLVVISGAACLLKWIDGRMTKSDLSGKIPSGKALLASPLVIPVLALVVSCTLSSVFSIVPAESWWGSYRRAQGAVALYCYVVLFSVVIRELRTPVQLRRLQYAFILTSLPVAGYTILQFLGPDFIPWTDVFYERSSASMGNPIFLGAYLVMVIPLTFSQLLDGFKSLRKNGDKRSGIVLSCCCGTALILQITALLCTQSRGPVLGLAVAGYICFFILLILNRTPGSRRPIFPVVAVGLGSVAAVMVVMIALMTSDLSVNTAAVCLGATVILVGAVYLFLWHTTFGRNWLWLAWLAQAAALALIFAAGPAHKIAAGAGLLPAFGRFVQFSDNSVLARRSIWQTGLDIMRSGAPATLPNGAEDGFHILRPAVGYGPECIWFPVNLHAVTGLVEIHSGNADRMHNEMYDQLISAGFVGAILYLFVFSAAMFYSLRYLGLVDGVRQRILFAVFIGGGSVAGVLLPWLYGMTEMAGVGIQAGLLAGMLGYVAWRGFCRTAANHVVPSSGHVLVLGVLGALIAHFGENAVGISVGTTRAYYFLLLAVLSVLVAGNMKRNTHAKKVSSKPVPWIQSPLPAFTAIAALVVLVEAWCFIVNTTAERSATALFFKTWFAQSKGQSGGFPLPGNLLLLLLTVVVGFALICVEKSRVHLQRKASEKSVRLFWGTTIFVWLTAGFLAAFFWAAGDPSVFSPMDNSLHAEARFTFFLFALVMLLAAMASALVFAGYERYAAAGPIRLRSVCSGILLAVGAFVIVLYLTVRPARADIACHIARVYERSGNDVAAVELFGRALRLAPSVVPYRISLGIAEERAAASDTSRLQEAAQFLKGALDLNPLDPMSSRTLGAFYMQAGERAADPGIKKDWIGKAIPCFELAIRLAPNNPQAYDELGRCHFLLGDQATAGSLYKKALQMYPTYAQTYIYMGELYYEQKNLAGALQSYSEAARLDRNNIEARKNAGLMLSLLGRKEEAIREYLAVLQAAPQDFLSLRQLSTLYFSSGDYGAGIVMARRAYDASPPENRPSFDDFLESVRSQAN